ncbi:hypothetical protein IMZ48_21410 [Candidatus Bathyarchaeota archaeon]|nr:hypothetical protein [Candidatus Bathyarchaeota archaeon]
MELTLLRRVQSSPRADSPAGAATGANVRPSSPAPPGGPRTVIRRRAAADQKDKIANARPTSTRSAGAGGSSSTMLSTFLHSVPAPRGVGAIWGESC